MENQELTNAPWKGSRQEAESLQAWLFSVSGNLADDNNITESLSPESIFPTAKNEAEIDRNTWRRGSFNIPSLQCSTVSDGRDELPGCDESTSTNIAGLDTEIANDWGTIPPFFRSTSSGLSVLLPWRTSNLLAAKQQQQQEDNKQAHDQSLDQNLPREFQPGGEFSNVFYQEAGYHETPPFQTCYCTTADDPSRRQKVEDLLQSQRAIFMDSLRNLSGKDVPVASTNVPDVTTMPNFPVDCGTVLLDPPTMIHSSAAGPAQTKKPPRHKKQPTKSSVSDRKLKTGRQRLRPMSAYNIWFKEERARIVGAPLHDENETAPTTKEDKRLRRKRPHNVIGFSDLGKLIGQRWRELSAEERAVYQEKARQDKLRYEAEKAAAVLTASVGDDQMNVVEC